MQAIFIRHAEAAPAGEGGDEARRLTPAGRKQARAAGKALRALGLRIEVILTSPMPRAAETAEIVSAAHPKAEVRVEQCLAPGGGAADVAGMLGKLRETGLKTVALVGHTPSLETCIARLVLGRGEMGISLSKAGAACVTLPGEEAGEPELRWLMRRKHLATIAARA